MQNTRSILPADLLAALHCIGGKLQHLRSVADEYEGVVEGLNRISPALLPRAESEIVDAARLYPDYPGKARASAIVPLFSNKSTDQEQLQSVPGLEFLFLFHRNGHIREAALRKVSEPIPSAFLFVALAWRLNDWVPQVRAAAADCAARVFPQTSPRVIVEAATVLLRRNRTWGRWGSERDLLDATFARADVAKELADLLVARTTGPSATILRQALRSTAMDLHLQRLSREAIQPAVRAVAAQALIDGYTSWPNGWRWRWIDKTMGIRQREAAFATRNLSVPIERRAAIETGLRDRSAAVRSLAISGLIRYREEVSDARALAEPLLDDPSRRVSERAAFLIR